MFGRATIKLGIGPHSSFLLFYEVACLRRIKLAKKGILCTSVSAHVVPYRIVETLVHTRAN